jgi:predicted MFS family arabinose efflux permease
MTGQSASQARRAGIQLVVRVFLPFACGYFLSFLYRSVNAIIAPDLVAEFGFTASDLGFVTAVYFLTFAAFQLPLGLLLDRFGPRRVQSTMLLIAAMGAVLFATGDGIGLLVLGRGLIGLGVAGALMSAFMSFALWFPPDRLPLANGCILAFGGLGALTATTPVEFTLQFTDWRGVFAALALGTALVAGLVFLSVPEMDARESRETLGTQLRQIGRIYGSRRFWRLAPLAITGLATGLSVQGLWAGTWLRDVAGLEQADVATHLLLMALGVTLGSVMSGLAAELAARIGVRLTFLFGLFALAFMILQVLIILEIVSLSYLLWGTFGLLLNGPTLAYAILSRSFQITLAGRVNTSLNLLMTASAFASQYLIGWVIDLWPLTESGGFAPQAYQVGFGALLTLQAAAFLWFLVCAEPAKPGASLEQR